MIRYLFFPKNIVDLLLFSPVIFLNFPPDPPLEADNKLVRTLQTKLHGPSPQPHNSQPTKAKGRSGRMGLWSQLCGSCGSGLWLHSSPSVCAAAALSLALRTLALLLLVAMPSCKP